TCRVRVRESRALRRASLDVKRFIAPAAVHGGDQHLDLAFSSTLPFQGRVQFCNVENIADHLSLSRCLPGRLPETPCDPVRQFPELLNNRRRVSAARYEDEWNLELRSALEPTISDALDVHSLQRSRDDGNAKPGGNKVQS